MPKRVPHAVHSACHAAHVHLWPLHAKVWIAWGIMGWRPAVVIGHRKTRVTVRVTDGLWPFVEGRRTQAHLAPNSLRPRKANQPPPSDSAYVRPSCVTLTGFCAPP